MKWLAVAVFTVVPVIKRPCVTFQVAAVANAAPESLLTLEVDNSVRVGPSSMLHRIRCVAGTGRVAWETLVSNKLTTVTGSRLSLVLLSLVFGPLASAIMILVT